MKLRRCESKVEWETDCMLLLGNVGGRQEIRSTQRRRLTGTHAHFYEEGTAEGTRVILPRESELGVGRNASLKSI